MVSAFANFRRSPTVESPPPAEVARIGNVSLASVHAAARLPSSCLVYAIDRPAVGLSSNGDEVEVIFAGLKTASVLAVVGAVVGEFLGGGAGLGQDLRVAGNRLAIDRVWGYAIILSVAGYLFYWVMAWLERRVVFWRRPLGVGEL